MVIPATHRHWKLNGRHSFDCLKLQSDIPTPSPQGSEVLVQMKAASLNYRDVAIIYEKYPMPVKDDLTPLSDGAGVVVAVGPHASRFRVGDNVIPTCLSDWITGRLSMDKSRSLGNVNDGVLQDYMIVDEQGLVSMPSNYDYVESSTLACAALTAWNALYGLKRVMPGDWVLTEGTGGVSLFAIQFAKIAGARVVATTSSDDKAKILQDLGVDHIINYRKDSQWGETARSYTTDGFDHIIEVGGSGTLQQAVKAIATEGIISLIGFLGTGETPDLMQTLYSGFIARGIGIGSRVQFEEMNRAIEANNIKPFVDKVFSFEDAREAYKHVEGQSFTGKVVIKFD